MEHLVAFHTPDLVTIDVRVKRRRWRRRRAAKEARSLDSGIVRQEGCITKVRLVVSVYVIPDRCR
eukprot:56254-Eustigmatos_ZCMA.PRE.1